MEQPAVQDELAERPQEEGLRFARRMYPPRVLGLALGALCIGGGLWQQGAPAAAWIALLVNSPGRTSPCLSPGAAATPTAPSCAT